MARHHRKPSDPQAIAQRRQERMATETEIGRLRSSGAVVQLDRARRIVSAYRASPFHKLRDSGTITSAQADAAQRLIEDWAAWKGLDGGPERSEVHAATFASSAPINDQMLQAGDRVAKVLDRIGPLDRALMSALVASAVEDDRPLPWRDVVRRVSGITQTVRQSAAVAQALENLQRAYRLH